MSYKDRCIKWIRDWFAVNGANCNAIVGISGGKDSTVVAALCVEALGKDRVIGVLMPNGEQKDIEDSHKVVDFLGIQSVTVNIGEIFGKFEQQISCGLSGINNYNGLSEQTRINLPPRIRMSTLYAIAQTLNGRVANTCNCSESFLGYSTLWGDDVGDFSPLGDLTCREVVELGDELGLPAELVHKTPSDGLCGKSDEDNLGFTYDEVDDYLTYGERKENYEAIIKRNKDTSFKKAYQIIPTFNISE